MRAMFYGCTLFDQDLSQWDTSLVDDMAIMFFNATSFSYNIAEWDVGSVETVENMFSGTGSFVHDLSDMQFTSVTRYGSFNNNSNLPDEYMPVFE
jgi:surface protein